MRRVALIVMALAFALPAAAADGGRPPASVAVMRSQAQPFAETATLRGRTEAVRRVEVRAEISGRVAEAPVPRGSVVQAGQPLCVLDPGERPAQLAEARAALRQTETDFEAGRRLTARGVTTETEQLSRAARLEAARAAVQRAEIDQARLVIAAPFAGVLDEDSAELGAFLQAGALCATVIAMDPILLVGFAAERDVDRLAVDAPATARLANGAQVEGALRFVARSADPATRTFRVEVEVPNPDLTIRDGLSAEIVLPLGSAPAHLAPQSALTLDDAGRLGVRLAEDGVARFAPVSIVADTPQGMWLAGLPDRADIIVVGQEYVADGQPLAPSYVDAVE
jgi:multidrug efflux system membrane fusion protein